jgi:hypothetical protein
VKLIVLILLGTHWPRRNVAAVVQRYDLAGWEARRRNLDRDSRRHSAGTARPMGNPLERCHLDRA